LRLVSEVGNFYIFVGLYTIHQAVIKNVGNLNIFNSYRWWYGRRNPKPPTSLLMDVVTAEHAKIAEEAGACAVMALERVPADIRAAGGVARMADPTVIEAIMKTVSIPVMAKCRIGHFVEAQALEALGVDYIDESEVLTPADESHHIWKHDFKVPFVCGCRNLGEALRRIGEGAAMIRTKGEAGTGNIVEAVTDDDTDFSWLRHSYLSFLVYHPLGASSSSVGICFMSNPGIASPRFLETSAMISGSL